MSQSLLSMGQSQIMALDVNPYWRTIKERRLICVCGRVRWRNATGALTLTARYFNYLPSPRGGFTPVLIWESAVLKLTTAERLSTERGPHGTPQRLHIALCVIITWISNQTTTHGPRYGEGERTIRNVWHCSHHPVQKNPMS